MEKNKNMYNDARMSTLSAYSPSFANEQSVVLTGKLRLSVLTSRLIRLEYSSQGWFEDRASQHVISRHFLYSGFQTHTQGDSLTLETEHLRLCVKDVNHPLSKDNLCNDNYNWPATTTKIDQLRCWLFLGWSQTDWRGGSWEMTKRSFLSQQPTRATLSRPF